MSFITITAISIFALTLFATFVLAMSRYKKCPSNKILVIYGKVGGGKSAKTIHGGAAFVWPFIQDYDFLELTPMNVDIDLQGALSKQNIRVNVPSQFTFGIGTEENLRGNAAQRLLKLSKDQIQGLARDIIFGQLRATIATMDIEEINADREKFEKAVMENIESELQKIGLKLINVNIADITDDSGYIEALGQKAAATVVNEAKVQVAQQNRLGAVGQAEAEQEQRTSVANANALAIQGENTASIIEAKSHADRREAEAEAKRKGDAAEAVKAAEAQAEGYKAEEAAEKARAERERATQYADHVVPAEIEKQTVVIAAEAEKEQAVLAGQAEGEALKAKLTGEAEGQYEILSKMAKGLDEIVKAAGGNPQTCSYAYDY